MSDNKAQLEISADASGVEAGVEQSKKLMRSLGPAARAAAKEASDGMAKAGDGGDAAAAKVERDTRRMIASVQRLQEQYALAGKTGSELFQAKAELRGIDPNVLRPYLDSLDATIAKQKAAGVGLNNMGISAAQTAAALRGVPAQMTDIVTSLQGGQKPMTVLLQQGGQLKDMFGGVGNAARAIGGYVLGLINPFTVLAGVLGVVGYAYMQGTKESEAYSRALILTGNAAGTTVGQLQGLAASVSRATGATQGAAAEVLAAFASNGNIANAQLEKFAGTAIRLEREAGIAVADTVKQFAELAKDPVDASVKLNESTRHLTTSVYDQIKALADQGRTADAAAVAMKSYSDVMDGRTDKLQANLGLVEQAWRGITGAAKTAWDAMLGIGRADTVDDQIKRLQSQLDNADQLVNRMVSRGQKVDTTRSPERIALEAQLAALRGIAGYKQLGAEADAEAAKSAQAKAEFDKRGLAFLTDQQKFQKALDLEVEEGQRLLAARAITAEQYATRILAVQKQFADKGTGKAAAIKPDAFLADVTKSYLDAIKDLAKIQSDGSAAADGLSKSQARLRDVMGSPEFAAFSRQQREQLIYAASLSQAEEDRQLIMKAAAESQKELAKTMADYAKATEDATIAARKAVQDAQTEYDNYGLLKSQIAQLTLARLEDARAAVAGYEDTSGIEARIEAQKRLIAILQSGEAREAGEKAAKAAAEEWKKTAEQINQSLTDALLRGFESGKDFATNFRDTLVNMFKTLVLRPIISAAVNPVAQGITGALGLSSAANAAGTAGSLLSGGSTLSNAVNLAGFGSGSSMFTQFAGSGIGQSLGLSATVDAIGGLETATTALTGAGNLFAAAMPWVAGGAALLALFGGNGFKSSAPTGSNVSNFDAAGNLASYRTSSSNDASAVADKIVNDLQAAYSKSAMSLGIGTTGTNFSYAGNTGAQGENPNFALGGGAGGKSFYQGETGLSDAAVSLAASRAVFAALQGSDLPQYLRSVFDGITAGSATQDQLAASLAYAASLKQVRDALLETRAPLQILQDNLAAGTASLHTSAESFKADFLAAIDAGITPEQLQQWQALQSTMDQLAAASGKAENAITAVTRSLADIAAERTRLQDQFDELTMTSAQLLAKQRSAIDESNRALFDQVQAQVALKDAAAAAASAASAAAAAYVAAAQAQAQAASQRLGTVTGGATEALAGLSRAIEAQRAQDTAAYQAQRAAATAIFNAQSSALQSSLDDVNASLGTVTDSVGKLKSLSSSLKGTLDGMRILGSEGDYRSGAQAQISDALAKARAGGGLPMDGQLESALRTVSQPSEKLFGSFVDYAKDFYKTANDIAALSALTDSQLTADQITQSILKDQADKLGDQQKTLKDGFADQVSTLDAILKNAQSQLDAANGLNTSVLSVADALQAFQASIIALTTERATQNLATSRGTTYSASDIIGGVKAMLASGASVSQIYDTGAKDYGLGASAITAATTGQGLVGFDTATGTRMQDYAQGQIADAIKAFMAVGATPADVYRVGGTDYGLSPAEIARAARAAGIPGFRVGTNRVPQDMLALVHKDEMIVPAQYNPAAGGVGNTARLEALVEQLTQKVAELQESSERGNFEIKRGSDAANGRQAAPIMVQLVDKNGALV